MVCVDTELLWIMEVMDRFWFYRTVLDSSEPSTSCLLSTTSPSSSASSSRSLSLDQHEDPLPLSYHRPLPVDEENYNVIQEQQYDDNETENDYADVEERPGRSTASTANRARSLSSSPPSTSAKRPENPTEPLGSNPPKSKSNRSLKDLELEEVKGFMDLGFVFTKEHSMNPSMVRLVPGLKRLRWFADGEIAGDDAREDKEEEEEDDDDDDDDDDEEDEERRGIVRPYLSEAWEVNRNIWSPRVSGAYDYDYDNDDYTKEELKFWAITVASLVLIEC